MFCPKCGNELATESAFCNKCGAALTNSNNNTAVQSQSINNTSEKKVNQITYALLALLLGGFGTHKFYAGKISLGIIYLLFCWTCIPAIIALIEGIIAFTKKADANGDIIL